MDIAVHAQLMASLCAQPFAQLILQVPDRYGGDNELARRLISTISHADKMAAVCRSQETNTMMLAVAEKLFEAASSSSFDTQSEAAGVIVGLIAHAHQMGRIVMEVSDPMFDAVRPVVEHALPTGGNELDRLLRQKQAVISEIGRLSHKALMERVRRGI